MVHKKSSNSNLRCIAVVCDMHSILEFTLTYLDYSLSQLQKNIL